MAETVKKRTPDAEVHFLGGQHGPEQRLAEDAGLFFTAITTTKLRRYLSWRTLLVPVEFVIAFFEALQELRTWRPDVLVSAGSYVAVPVIWAAALLGIPVLIHQQDIRKGLANTLTAPFARKITVTFEQSLKDFSANKVVCIGNPVRNALVAADVKNAAQRFGIIGNTKVLLVLGGSSGAVGLNHMIRTVAPALLEQYQILHITGEGKKIDVQHPQYHAIPFLAAEDMANAYSVADVVVCRAGLSTFSELAAFARATIFVPLPGTHQEENAMFAKKHDAAVIVHESEGSAVLQQKIKELMEDEVKSAALASSLATFYKTDAADRAAEYIEELAHE
jgi:UDP-N-acetylglucosamine--N-acetylmuramyl-(pentapeptide) pyrophosphoryl-undecaprenol N-acetylglucosamine transferase